MLKHLMSEYKLGNLTLKNRVVMAPMTRSRAIDNLPNSLMATYYGNRTGAGLIITEGTSPSVNGLGYPRIPGCFTQEQMQGWKQVTDEVHREGGKIFLQIMHTGRVTHPDNLPAGGRVLAPSPVEMTETKMYVDGKGELPIPVAQEMTIDDITEAVAEYANCAKLAIDAGFDGVELHAANGYLLEQFLHPKTNNRTDQFGGSIENRLRFVRNVTEATVAAIGGDRVGMRVSPFGYFGEMGEFEGIWETFTELCEMMNEIGIVYMHIVDHSGMGTPPVPEDMKELIRSTFNGAVIFCGNYNAEHAERDLSDYKCHLIGFGRPFIANPDLVERFREEAELTIPEQDKFYTPGPDGYIDYPMLSDES